MPEFSDNTVTRSHCTVCLAPIFWQTDPQRNAGVDKWEHAISFTLTPHTPVSAQADPEGS